MNDPALVRRFQAFRDLFGNRQHLVDGNGTLDDATGQRLSFHELQNERLEAIRFLESINRCDVRVVQRGEDVRFALEAREAVDIQCEGFRSHLESHVAIERGITRSIDLAHSARAEKLEDLIWTERIAGVQDAPVEVGHPAGCQVC